MILRNYQEEAITAQWNYFFNNYGNPLVVMPTGTGKSLVIAAFIRKVLSTYGNQKILVLTHVKELIEQDYNTLLKFWPNAPAGIYSAGLKRRDVCQNVIFAGIGSIAKTPDIFGRVDLVLIDEAHLVSPTDTTMYRKTLDALKQINPYLKVIGYTATDYRLGQGKLTDGEKRLFTDVCYDISTLESFNRLINEGYLAPLIPKHTSTFLNVENVKVVGGEFSAKELQLAVDKIEITKAAINETIEIGYDRQAWLVFTAGVEHCVHTTELLNAAGISALAVHGNTKEFRMSSKERDHNIQAFKDGKVRALVNNNILTTGFDHPGIDLIVVLRPLMSPGLWVQMLGRGTRPFYAPGYPLDTIQGRLDAIANSVKQNCMVLDFAGNTHRLGPINDPRVPRKKGSKTGPAPVKLCVGEIPGGLCNTWIHASIKVCPECGNEFKFKTKLKETASTDELIKSDLPVTEEFEVEHITYNKHLKKPNPQGLPPTLKVTYHCKVRSFTEHVCLQHKSNVKHLARKWWNDRSELTAPETIAEALDRVNELAPATSIRVWINKRYPEILAYCFDGSRFGATSPSNKKPTIELEKKVSKTF